MTRWNEVSIDYLTVGYMSVGQMSVDETYINIKRKYVKTMRCLKIDVQLYSFNGR